MAKKVVFLIVIFLILGCTFILYQDNSILNEVKSGEKVLTCYLGEWKEIDPAKVVDFSDKQWTFTNGYASNCTLK